MTKNTDAADIVNYPEYNILMGKILSKNITLKYPCKLIFTTKLDKNCDFHSKIPDLNFVKLFKEKENELIFKQLFNEIIISDECFETPSTIYALVYNLP